MSELAPDEREDVLANLEEIRGQIEGHRPVERDKESFAKVKAAWDSWARPWTSEGKTPRLNKFPKAVEEWLASRGVYRDEMFELMDMKVRLHRGGQAVEREVRQRPGGGRVLPPLRPREEPLAAARRGRRRRPRAPADGARVRLRDQEREAAHRHRGVPCPGPGPVEVARPGPRGGRVPGRGTGVHRGRARAHGPRRRVRPAHRGPEGPHAARPRRRGRAPAALGHRGDGPREGRPSRTGVGGAARGAAGVAQPAGVRAAGLGPRKARDHARRPAPEPCHHRPDGARPGVGDAPRPGPAGAGRPAPPGPELLRGVALRGRLRTARADADRLARGPGRGLHARLPAPAAGGRRPAGVQRGAGQGGPRARPGRGAHDRGRARGPDRARRHARGPRRLREGEGRAQRDRRGDERRRHPAGQPRHAAQPVALRGAGAREGQPSRAHRPPACVHGHLRAARDHPGRARGGADP